MIFKFILILFRSIIKQHIKNKFKDRKKLIKDLNDSIDIPFINEKTEEKFQGPKNSKIARELRYC